MSVDGTKELEKMFSQLSKVQMKQEVEQAIQIIRSAAAEGVPVGHGELRRSIFTDVHEEEDSVIGECFTNKEYAIYVEFGTGPRGQEKHDGISPEHHPVYTQSPWWIHESQIDEQIAEKYHLFSIDTPQGKFYQSSGQAAHPFMHPALHDNEDIVLKDFATHLAVNLEGIVK